MARFRCVCAGPALYNTRTCDGSLRAPLNVIRLERSAMREDNGQFDATNEILIKTEQRAKLFPKKKKDFFLMKNKKEQIHPCREITRLFGAR